MRSSTRLLGLARAALLSLPWLWPLAAVTPSGPAVAAETAPEDTCSISRRLTRIRPDPDGEPVAVHVGIALIDLSEINEVAESFGVDFKLVLQWRDPRLAAEARGASLEDCRLGLADIWHPEIDLVNQRSIRRDPQRDVDVSADGTVQFSERIFAELHADLDLRPFPFDRQRLKIQLASFEYGPDDVVFVVDRASTGRLDAIRLAGWRVLTNSSDADVAPVRGKIVHTRLDHTIVVARQAAYHVWTVVVPLCLIALMAWSVFWLDPEIFAPQIGVATASIFTLIAFRLGLSRLLPRVSYLTRADELVLAVTALVFLALGEVILTSRLAQRGRLELARRIDLYGRWGYLAVFGLLMWLTLGG